MGYNKNMEVKSKQVEEYITSDNQVPFRTWLDNLKDAKARVVIHSRITRLRAGLLGHVDPVGEGVHELKVDFGPGYRVYFGNDGETIVILLCGGTKRTQTTDITMAKGYWKDYKRRKQKESP